MATTQLTGKNVRDGSIDLTVDVTGILPKANGGAGYKRVVALTDGSTIAVNCDTTDIGSVTLGGNRTLSNPTGTPADGQMIEIRALQDGTGSRTLAYGTAYAFSVDVPSPTLTATASKMDRLLFEYRTASTKWELLAIVHGY